MRTPVFLKSLCAVSLVLLVCVSLRANTDWIETTASEGGFAIVDDGIAATIVISSDDEAVVSIAAEDLVNDVAAVTGVTPELGHSLQDRAGPLIVIGTLGQSAVVDELMEGASVSVAALEGAWESFVIETVEVGDRSVLAIVGSDRRGTAYGVYTLSEAIGVSPWHWWADVPARRSETLFVKAGVKRFGPPSVKYRGIFINDEDWGLHPWAAHTFDPELGDIGPKTYEKVFELLLRLKANTLWPAMHEVTKAFNLYPENKVLADRYGIVMASSHAEPLLRNNVTEWAAPKSDYNYASNADGLRTYWSERLQENGTYENVYTLGMRGIHDSGMTDGGSVEEKIAFLDTIIEDQRELLAEHVDPAVSEIPQVFTPYKEVLELYRGGLEVPDDVTIVWPDDNHGYIRTFPNAEERKRSGGSGVYYHLSYLGSPLAYLWLYTTPPALVWEEMNRAYQLGARDYWIVNVGDIKPGEIGMEFFLQMAWDIERWNLDTQDQFLETWAARTFGSSLAEEIAEVMEGYFALNFQRRPEHLQWFLPHSRARSSPLSGDETRERLLSFQKLVAATERIETKLSQEQADAFFQLVKYPVIGSSLANEQYFHVEQYGRLFNADPAAARIHGSLARRAAEKLEALTRYYNEELADGKWQRMMAVEPADTMWRSFRTLPIFLPAEGMTAGTLEESVELSELRFGGAGSAEADIELEAEAFSARSEGAVRWDVIDELGWSGSSIGLFPVDATIGENGEDQTPWVDYSFSTETAGDYNLWIDVLPTYSSGGGDDLKLFVSINGGHRKSVSSARKTKSGMWKREVLDGRVGLATKIEVAQPGEQILRIYGTDTGVIVDRLYLHGGDLRGSFNGPAALN